MAEVKEVGFAQSEAAEIQLGFEYQYALFSVVDRTGISDTVFNFCGIYVDS